MTMFDDPSIAFALLAVIVGLRLALFFVERLLGARAAEPMAPVISPDDVTDESPHPLGDTPEPVQLPSEHETHPFRFATEILDSAWIAVALVFFLIRPFLLQAFYIPSESMVPTLQNGDKLLAAKFTFHMREPHRQEIVVFHAPKDALEELEQTYDPKHPVDYVKRVIGLPKDHIRIRAYDGVYVNGQKLNEPYLAEIPNYDYPTDEKGNLTLESHNEIYQRVRDAMVPNIKGDELIVPDGYLFVMGDNRNKSHDSHYWGLLPRSALVGKAVFIFWPFNRIGFVH